MKHARIAVLAMLGACTPVPERAGETAAGVLPRGPETRIATQAAADLPSGLRALVQQAVPNMIIAEVERKDREGRIYYDVEGRRPDGSAIELDIQQIGDRFEIVEIQRDVAFADMPPPVQSAARAAAGAFAPKRVIESTQTDGSVIYELFAEGKPAEPAMEVRLKDGKVEVLTERWPH